MTRTTTLSNISITAVVLLAASASCFAQAQSAEIRGEASIVVAMTAPVPAASSSRPNLTTAEPRLGMLNVEPKSATEVALSEKSRSLSPEAFRMGMGQFAAVENQHVFGQPTTIYETGLGNFKKQFRADDDSSAARPEKAHHLRPIVGPKIA